MQLDLSWSVGCDNSFEFDILRIHTALLILFGQNGPKMMTQHHLESITFMDK